MLELSLGSVLGSLVEVRDLEGEFQADDERGPLTPTVQLDSRLVAEFSGERDAVATGSVLEVPDAVLLELLEELWDGRLAVGGLLLERNLGLQGGRERSVDWRG